MNEINRLTWRTASASAGGNCVQVAVAEKAVPRG